MIWNVSLKFMSLVSLAPVYLTIARAPYYTVSTFKNHRPLVHIVLLFIFLCYILLCAINVPTNLSLPLSASKVTSTSLY